MSKAEFSLGTGGRRKKRRLWLKAFLVIIILSMLGGMGFYVYYAQKQAKATLDAADAITASTKPLITKGLNVKDTDGWSGFSSEQGDFSLKYPSTWVQPAKSKQCPVGLFDRAVYLGPVTGSVLRCGYMSITPGQISVVSFIGDHRQQYDLSGKGYTGIAKSTLNVDGVVGTKMTATVSGSGLTASDTLLSNFQSAAASSGSTASSYKTKLTIAPPVSGTFVERYIFFNDNNTYVAEYTQAPKTNSQTQQDVQKYFDLMVAKTLKFSAG